METKKNPKGRKPADDPKVSLRIYVPISVINKIGGYVASQEEILQHITKKARRIK